MKKLIPPLKGTRDFYPEEMAIRNWLYSAIRQVSESFGYLEYEGPFLESIELYAAKSGEELVKEQSFVFPDRGGDLITLRPELTPTLVRMIAQRQHQLVFPLRWWSWGPMWRYERPQKGREREFFQWNVDLIGVASPEADAELVCVVAAFFQKVGLTPRDVVILINNRRLMYKELEALGVPLELRPQVSRFIDRRDKMEARQWEAYGKEIGLNVKQLDGILTMLANRELWRQSEELARFFNAVEAAGMGEYVRFDPAIVRGLDYYTGTVFEAQESGEEIRRAILGGGRYDNLMADVGGEPLPGVGFAMGDVVITLLLKQCGLIPEDISLLRDTVLVTIFDQERLIPSFKLTTELRQAGLRVSCYPEVARLPKQFKYADRVGMRVVVVLGPDELAQGKVTIKNLATGTQQTVDRQISGQTIRSLLESSIPS